MFKRSIVRLIAAATAAISLHALALILLPSLNEISIGTEQGVLQLDLLPQHATEADRRNHPIVSKTEPSKQATAKATDQTGVAVHAEKLKRQSVDAIKQASQIKTLPVPLVTQQPVIITTKTAQQDTVILSSPKAVQQQRIQAQSAGVNIDVVKKHNQQASAKLATPVHADALKIQADEGHNKSDINVVPNSVRAYILAEVHYPRQARRRGWQGNAEFQFDVHQQTIQTITLLASSGYPVLDRAAHRGLSAVTHVSLSNGLYRMPVVFRLQ